MLTVPVQTLLKSEYKALFVKRKTLQFIFDWNYTISINYKHGVKARQVFGISALVANQPR